MSRHNATRDLDIGPRQTAPVIKRNNLTYVWQTNAPRAMEMIGGVMRGGLGEHVPEERRRTFPGQAFYKDGIIGPAAGRQNQNCMVGIYTPQAKTFP